MNGLRPDFRDGSWHDERWTVHKPKPIGVFYCVAGVVATCLGIVILAAVATGLWVGLST